LHLNVSTGEGRRRILTLVDEDALELKILQVLSLAGLISLIFGLLHPGFLLLTIIATPLSLLMSGGVLLVNRDLPTGLRTRLVLLLTLNLSVLLIMAGFFFLMWRRGLE
jgi:hypothetical protein